MGANANSIPAGLVPRVFKGLEGEPSAVIDSLPGIVELDVTDLAGTIPTLPTSSLLSREDDAGLAEGVRAREIDVNMGSATYLLKRYTGFSKIPDGTRIDMDGKGAKTLELFARLCLKQANTKLNRRLNTVLTSTSLNKEQAAGTAFTDAASTPIQILQAAFEKCGYGDTLVLGRDVLEAFQVHPDFIARTSNFDGGAVGTGEVVNILRNVFNNLRNVYAMGHIHHYNSATEGQTAVLAYPFDGTLWVGHAEDIVKVEQPGANAETGRDILSESEILRYTRRVDIVRPNQDTGCVVTGAI